MMKPTNEERREVAERLRGLPIDVYEVEEYLRHEGIDTDCHDQTDYYLIHQALLGCLPAEHMHPCDYEELHARLADLIEPEPEKTSKGGGPMSQFYVKRECWQRFPKTLIMVKKNGYGDEFRRYVPERKCYMNYDGVHEDYVCSACGEWHDTGTYDARDADDRPVFKEYRYCPNCGAEVVDDE